MLLTSLLVLSQPAAAIDVKWWGVGPTVGTVAIPGKYPVLLPANAKDADGIPMVEKTQGDISFGAHAVLYPTAAGRIGARGLVGLGIGSPWTSGQITFEYDLAVVKEEGFQLLLGVGVGAGTERFGGTDAHPDSYLVANYFPIRAQVTGLLRDKTRAYELDIWGDWHIVADQTWYSEKGATGVTGADAAIVPGALYLKLGIEATVFFGDFRSQKKTGGGK